MRQREAVFVDSGACIALALSRDPLHAQAREQWDLLQGAAAKLHTSVPVVIETSTLLEQSWEFFRRTDLHKLSAVDATSFAIMRCARIRLAFTFDHHFSVAGFRFAT